jgi:hypothetical protein
MSSDNLHPADFLAELASAIKAVRARGGKWNKTADTIEYAYDRIVRLEKVASSACPRDGCPYVDGPDFGIGNPCRCK